MRTGRLRKLSIAVALGALAALVPLGGLPKADASIVTLGFGYPCGSGNATTGDFNGDGRKDLAVGAPGDNLEQVEIDGTVTNSTPDAGSVSVAYADPAAEDPEGLDPAFEPGGLRFISEDTPGIAGDGADANDSMGFALTSGDFNGDGESDLAIGEPGAAVKGVTRAGAVRVLYGSDGPGASGGLGTANDQLWSQEANGIADFAEQNDFFGYALAAGDANGDGKDDLWVGVPREDYPGGGGTLNDAGEVHLIYGSSGGLTGSGSALIRDGNNSPVNGVELARAESGDVFGAALATGDLDGDGGKYDDVAVGMPGEDLPGIADAGSVAVLYNQPPSGGTTTNPVGRSFFHLNSNDVPGSANFAYRMGCSLAAGNFDGDVPAQDAELAIGIPGYKVGTGSNSGATLIMYNAGIGTAGQRLGIRASQPTNAQACAPGTCHSWRPAQLWTENSPGVPGVAKVNDRFGASLAAGDFNGDNASDLTIGVPTEHLYDDANAGSIRMLFGIRSGPSVTGGLAALFRGAYAQSPSDPDSGCPLLDEIGCAITTPEDYSPLFMTEQKDDLFGASVQMGDFDGDGKSDIAIGVPGEDLGGNVNYLTEEVLNIGCQPFSLCVDEIMDAGVVNIIYGEQPPVEPTDPPSHQDVLYRSSGTSLRTLVGPIGDGLGQHSLEDNRICSTATDPDCGNNTALVGDNFGVGQS